jgi:hypothetical protein
VPRWVYDHELPRLGKYADIRTAAQGVEGIALGWGEWVGRAEHRSSASANKHLQRGAVELNSARREHHA